MSARESQDSTDRSPATAATARQSGPWTVRALLAWMTPFLKERSIDSPRMVAEILLGAVLDVERLRLYMEPDRELDPSELARLRELVGRAARHEPVQFLVGRWPFLGRDFEVEPCTLIPRPCTELLVERALAWFREREAGGLNVLDLCTGSGCIGVTLALGLRAINRPVGGGCAPLRATDASNESSHHATQPALALEQSASARWQQGEGDAALESPPRAHSPSVSAPPAQIRVVATDIIPQAVALARRNAERLGATVEFHVGDLYEALPIDACNEQFDLIVANPPYVTDAEYAELDKNVREYEPASALRGGVDGLDCVRRVIDGAAARLAPHGVLLVEIGWKHADAVRVLVNGNAWRAVTVLSDGDGHPRLLEAHRA